MKLPVGLDHLRLGLVDLGLALETICICLFEGGFGLALLSDRLTKLRPVSFHGHLIVARIQFQEWRQG